MPSLRERMRPVELLVLAALCGAFVGGFVLLASRTWQFALVMATVAFIVALVVLATLLITIGSTEKPPEDQPEESSPDQE